MATESFVIVTGLDFCQGFWYGQA